MTSKGQVTVPKDIRDALGLRPGSSVGFAIDENGDAKILKADCDASAQARKAAFRARLSKASAIFKANDRFPGMTTDSFMSMIREPLQPFERKPGK